MFLFTTPDGDIWKIYSWGGTLAYTYTLVGRPLEGISSFLGAIDKKGYLHLLLKSIGNQYIYSYWEGQRWCSLPLPVQGCGNLYGLVVDNTGKRHILLGLLGEVVHLIRYHKQWFMKNLPFRLYGEPLRIQLWGEEYLFLCWEEIKQNVKKIFYAFYQGGDWSSPALLLEGPQEVKCYVYFTNSSKSSFEIHSFVWEPQGEEYQLYWYITANSRSQVTTHVVGDTLGIPDSYPLLLSSRANHLLCWTVHGQFTFSIKGEEGSWTRPQGDYLFFPTSIRPLLSWNGWNRDKVAFTRVGGLHLDWPLIVGVDQILPYCKGALAVSKR
ncbi:hypothetical protein [Thermanaeromonas toyohensis]|nr:hypothetical protein [Thermanaeromonas toyohensis]